VTDKGEGSGPDAAVALGLSFTNPELFTRALTHPSLTGGRQVDRADNQRLEWLGDRVLGLVIARHLFDAYPTEDEGELARRLAALVSAEALTVVARALDLGQHLRLAASEEASGGRNNPSNLADACEALIGALYLDGGVAAAQAFIEKHWAGMIADQYAPPKDPKTALQEWSQARGLGLPDYRLVASEGPDHKPVFRVSVEVPGHGSAEAKGGGKRDAERLAAERLMEKLTGDHG
jgi:ribonuclease-3